jgi:hypothetical protein
MSKLYVIKFNESKEKIKFPDDKNPIPMNNNMMGFKLIKGTRKELELRILERLFKNAMNSQQEISKSFECKDCIDQIKNLDGEMSIRFTKDDIEYLKLGYSKTADSRPDVWMEECSDLFKQIDNPEEEKINKN